MGNEVRCEVCCNDAVAWNDDTWGMFTGYYWPEGFDKARTCPQCGRVHTDDLIKLVEAGWEIRSTTQEGKIFWCPPGTIAEPVPPVTSNLHHLSMGQADRINALLRARQQQPGYEGRLGLLEAGSRTVERLEHSVVWNECQMQDLIVGDRFRMFSPNGVPVIDPDGHWEWVACADASKVTDPDGFDVYGVQSEYKTRKGTYNIQLDLNHSVSAKEVKELKNAGLLNREYDAESVLIELSRLGWVVLRGIREGTVIIDHPHSF